MSDGRFSLTPTIRFIHIKKASPGPPVSAKALPTCGRSAVATVGDVADATAADATRVHAGDCMGPVGVFAFALIVGVSWDHVDSGGPCSSVDEKKGDGVKPGLYWGSARAGSVKL